MSTATRFALPGILSRSVMKYLSLLLLIAFLVFSGCSGDGSSDLPVSTVLWEQDENWFFHFSTNDSQYYTYRFWTLFESIFNPDTFEIECMKASGSRDRAYGLIFGASDTETDRYYYLLITTQGYYMVGKRDVNDTVIREWEKALELKTGYNNINNLKVVREDSSYTVFLNDFRVFRFTDSDIEGTRVGITAYVGNEREESFPRRPVDVRFRILQTITIPFMVSPAAKMEMADSGHIDKSGALIKF